MSTSLELRTLLATFDQEYPIHYLQRINQLLKNQTESCDYYSLIFDSDFMSKIIMLLQFKKYNFMNLFDGFVINNCKRYIAKVIGSNVQRFCCDVIINYDDVLTLQILKVFSYFSFYAKSYQIEHLANESPITPLLTTILMSSITTIQVKAESIFILSNLAEHSGATSHILHDKIESNHKFIKLIKLLIVFLTKCEVNQFPRLIISKHSVSSDALKATIISEILRFMCNFRLINWCQPEEMKVCIISLLSMIRACDKHQIHNGESFISMIYRIALTSKSNQIHVLKLLFAKGLIAEVIKYLLVSTCNKKLQHFGIKTMSHCLRFEIGQAPVKQLIENGLLQVVTSIIKSNDSFYARKEGVGIKMNAISILENILENFPLAECLFRDDTQILQYISKVSVLSSAGVLCNKLIRTVCKCIVKVNEQEILYYYHKEMFMNFMLHRMFNDRTDAKTMRTISTMIKKMTRYFNDEVSIFIGHENC